LVWVVGTGVDYRDLALLKGGLPLTGFTDGVAESLAERAAGRLAGRACPHAGREPPRAG
jgi:hypothetical protein